MDSPFEHPGVPIQNTHTSSTLVGSSRSAARLMARYGDGFDTEAGWAPVLDEINQVLGTRLQGAALDGIYANARRFLMVLATEGVDRRSRVSAGQLVALLWRAIQDIEKTTTTFEQARDTLFRAFGSLAHQTVSTSSIFYRLLAEMSHVHPDIDVGVGVEMTKALSGILLQRSVRRYAAEYLISERDVIGFDTLSNDDLWEAIKDRNREKLFFEVASVYLTGESLAELNDFRFHYASFEELEALGAYPDFQHFFAGCEHAEFDALAESGEYLDFEPVIQLAGLLQGAGALATDVEQTKFKDVCERGDADQAIDVIHCLERNQLLAPHPQTHDAAVMANPNLEYLLNVLNAFEQAGVLQQVPLEDLLHHPNTRALYAVIESLSRQDLLTAPNILTIVGQQHPQKIASVMSLLNEAGLLTQDNFSRLIQHAAILFDDHAFDDEDVTNTLSKIPPHLLTQARLNEMIGMCDHHQQNPVQARATIQNYVRYEVLEDGQQANFNTVLRHLTPQQTAAIFGALNQAGVFAGQNAQHQNLQLNPGQSAHTASIHKSASESAIRLMTRYGSHISDTQLDEVIESIKTWVHARPVVEGGADYAINPTAKRSINKLTAPTYFFEDPKSGVSVRQLLALTWLAIHDDAARTATLEDAEAMFLEGLYDAQRTYNLSDTFVDNQAPDSPACTGGTFNKLLEKLTAVHPDVEMLYITPAGAALKLQKLVLEKAETCLVSNPKLTEALIWPAIKNQVTARLFFEFASLYLSISDIEVFDDLTRPYDTFEELEASENFSAFQTMIETKARQDFHGLVGTGQDVDLSDVLKNAQAKRAVEKTPQEIAREARLKLFDTKRDSEDGKPKADDESKDDAAPSINP